MRRFVASLCLVAFAAVASADGFSFTVPQLAASVNARIAAIDAAAAPTKLEKREAKKLRKASDLMLTFQETGGLRDLFVLADIGKPLLASRTQDAAVENAVIAVANCILTFVQGETQDAAAARAQLTTPEYQAKIDKSLAKADKLFAAATAAFNQNPGAAVSLLVDAAIAYRKIRNKSYDLDEAENLAGV